MSSPAPGSPGEFDLIARFRARAAGADPRVVCGIGDDCALLTGTGDRRLLVTTDMLMDGRHFWLDQAGPLAVGRKAMGVNLSDIAAMAGRPLAAVVAVSLPRAQAASIAEPLFEGLASMAERFETPLVGGDTNAWDGPLVVCVTVLGTVDPPGPALRSAARPGDVVLVTGPLGGSLKGRHLEPVPRFDAARALRQATTRLALIDLSDGLASDLGHILAESGGLGAILDADAIPIHPDALAMAAQDGRSPLAHALGDGEDFELCATLAPEEAAGLLQAPPVPGLNWHRVGLITAEPGLWLRDARGRLAPCTARGFDHLAIPSEAQP